MTTAPPKDGSIRPLLPVLLTVLIDLLGFGLVIPLLSYYAEEHGANAVQVTLLMASYSIAQFFFAPFWGMVSDRMGRRPVMLISIAGTALSLAGFAASGSLPLLFLFRTLNGACAANISTAQAFVADLTTPENRAKGMGLIGAAFGLGFSFGPWLGGELAHFGLSAPIWVAAGLASVNFVWAASALPESRPTTTSARSIDPRALLAGIAHPTVGLAILLTFAATFAFSMMEATFALVAEHAWEMGPMQVGRMFFVIGLVGIVIQGGLIGRLARAWGEPTLILAGMTFNALGLAALGAAAVGGPDETWALVGRWLGCVLVALGSSLVNPSLSALISRGVEADEQGAILGANQSLGALARATAPTTGGLFYHHWFRGGAFVAGSVMLFLTLPLALPAVRRAHRAA